MRMYYFIIIQQNIYNIFKFYKPNFLVYKDSADKLTRRACTSYNSWEYDKHFSFVSLPPHSLVPCES